ncbi:HPr family phosphocarrier protein [Suttonella sp. R2A3]|uniref:HPr family phosphocarrier protein n=1 Tax=Suttonella sp. R2A3 TaxID=2908648 RepID=UPI001F2ADBCD|nr:HPr family phosphocarrier protein [Suttonella sp. R2A3]UJF24015.1 HPr family phosphocarrier protein [Suttonella sp. R2A3]
MQEQQLTLKNASGLHARPARNFVRQAKNFASSVEVIKAGNSYNGKSLMKLLQAGLSQGDSLILQVSGEDENEALTALVAFIENLDE